MSARSGDGDTSNPIWSGLMERTDRRPLCGVTPAPHRVFGPTVCDRDILIAFPCVRRGFGYGNGNADGAGWRSLIDFGGWRAEEWFGRVRWEFLVDVKRKMLCLTIYTGCLTQESIFLSLLLNCNKHKLTGTRCDITSHLLNSILVPNTV